MVYISEDEHDDNVPLIKSLKELTSEPRSTGNPTAPKLEYPSASRIVRAGPNLDADGKPRYLIDEIPDNEKMRLIRESGIMNKYAKDKNHGTGSDVEEEDILQYEDEEERIPTWMDALIYTVALTAVYGLFEALVNQQYNVEVGFMEVLERMAKSAPAIYCIVFLTCRYRRMRVVNLLMLMASCASGCYFIHLNLHSPRLGIMRRAPGLVTLWIYLTFLMDVRPSIISAIVVGLFWMLDPFKADI
ncbi:hypothetical protein IW146_001052 [Coemansia sp. RSA 922]|nr:hypothetical protein LPJ71_003602 [Coemansia sp. S17]KAJ2018160.1 hypothetical protein GGI14_002501 [Coemansia sp. S680]KAJ2037078.1 hypothetical protein H4S03_003206 [Coemansia sp. S3946]KAJ2053453.1 hypothetical protein H4S04_000677 [Coemansia sp. S16]KAJ2117065.1 hypothetical protein IW146_001052 [Coemansia sp. RSA 922]KAJ2430543.1 hypothetical protein GGF41_000938 [Coemansia sp. RSA 2531]